MGDIRELQMEELKMLKLLDGICKKHHLRYFLLGGTLLGAVRHKGFIPWDDDVDVAMPREDYDQLLKIAKTDLEEPFEIQNFDTDAQYHYAWARIINTKIKVMNHSANVPRQEDLWIDLIPLDGFPDPGLRRRIHKLKLSFWWNLNQFCQYDEMVDQKRKRGKLQTIAVKAGAGLKWIGRIVDYRTCLRHLNQTLKEYPYGSQTKDVINYLAAYGFREVFPRKSFQTAGEYSFEGDTYPGPADFDVVLQRIYGDYMTLPPEKDRNKHHLEILEKNLE